MPFDASRQRETPESFFNPVRTNQIVKLAELSVSSHEIEIASTTDEPTKSCRKALSRELDGELDVDSLGSHAHEDTSVCLDKRSIAVYLLLDEDRSKEIQTCSWSLTDAFDALMHDFPDLVLAVKNPSSYLTRVL